MACDMGLLDGVLDDRDDEEDWTSTQWDDPNSGPQTSTQCSETNSGPQTSDKAQAAVDFPTGNRPGVASDEKGESIIVQSMLLNDNKAGMEGLDKTKINQIIQEASRGSKFYEKERQKDEQMKKRILEQREKIKLIPSEQLRQGIVEADKLLEDFEQQRDLSHTIVHIDMDAFYAAVEMRDEPSLKDKPMAVGGNSMLSTSNYRARKFGVRAAMPGFIARKLCPELVIVPANPKKYSVVSKQVKAIIAEYDPNFCPMSLDEAYLDLTEHLENRQTTPPAERTFLCRNSNYADSRAYCKCDLNEMARKYENIDVQVNSSSLSSKEVQASSNTDSGINFNINPGEESACVVCPDCGQEFPPFTHVTFGISDEDAVRELRTRIEQKTNLTASAGIAPNMMLAKVCSDKNKPNGQYKISASREDIINFIKDLPTRKISGIGKVSEAMLNAVGVYTCSDLHRTRGLLYHLYSQISFNYFMRICRGIGSTTVERHSDRKSMSTERTFSEISKPADLYRKCEELCVSLSEDLKSEQLKGKTISIKIKTVKFEVFTRAHTVRDYTNDYEDVVWSATELLKTEIQQCAPQPLKLRLMGVRMSNLLHESVCLGKKQNTIIGAFKRLAKPAIQQKRTEGARMKEDIHAGMEGTTVIDRSTETAACVEEGLSISDGDVAVHDDVIDIVDISEISKDYGDAVDLSGDSADNIHATNEIHKQNECVANIPFDNNDTIDTTNDINKNNIVDIPGDSANTADTISKISTDNWRVEECKLASDNIDKCDKPVCDTAVSAGVNVDPESTLSQTSIDSSILALNVKMTRSGLVRTPSSKVRRKRNSSRGAAKDPTLTYECPVCYQNVLCECLQSFNDHVDMCLENCRVEKRESTVQKERLVESDIVNIGKLSKYQTNAGEELADDIDMPTSTTLISNEKKVGSSSNVSRQSKGDSESKFCIKRFKVLDTLTNEKETDFDVAKHDVTISDDHFECDNDCQTSVSADLVENTNTTRTNKDNHIDHLRDDHCEIISIAATHMCNSELKCCKIPTNIDIEASAEMSRLDWINSDSIGMDNVINKNQAYGMIHEPGPIRDCSDNSQNIGDAIKYETGTTQEAETEEQVKQSPIVMLIDKTETAKGSDFGKIQLETVVPPISSNIIENSQKTIDCNYTHSETSTTQEDSNKVFASCSKQWNGEDFQTRMLDIQSCIDGTDETEDVYLEDAKDGGVIDSEGSLLVCPICNIQQRSADLNEFIFHIDMCLNRGAISEMLGEQKKQDRCALKRNCLGVTPTNTKPAKKRKTTPNYFKPRRSISSFFQEK